MLMPCARPCGTSESVDEVVIEGEVVRVTFESDRTGFRVIRVKVDGEREPLAVVGSFPAVGAGARVRVTGVRETTSKHGEQLRATSVTELGPATLRGLERYLASGSIKGIGEKSAERIVKHFGMDALRVLDKEPDRLSEVTGLGKARARQIADAWREQRGVREIMMFLQAHGASLSLAQRIHKRYGHDAMSIVSRQPYRLAMEVFGVGFATADRVAQSIGIREDAPERMQAGVLHALGEATDSGHCYCPEAELLEKARALLGQSDDAPLTHALAELVLGGFVIVEEIAGERVYFTRFVHRAETRLAAKLVSLARESVAPLPRAEETLARFEERQGVTLAALQREAVLTAAASSVLVITGGPGVGKTTVLRAILAVTSAAGLTVRLAAPTGRAAKRMSEATGHAAQTLHRLLEFDPKSGGFKRGAESPIEAQVIVVDEASMLDLAMADSLTQAVAVGSRLLLVGDVDQLPSVGPGAVLRDVIASGVVRAVRLLHIYRQAEASLIVQNAHRINRGEPPTTPPPDQKDADFFVMTRQDPEAARATAVELVTSRIPRRFGLDPMRDVQVLVPMNRGDAGSLALNAALAQALNPTGPSITRGGRTFRVNDKVMQLRNDYDKDVWNGDVGFVESVDTEASTLKVRFDDRVVAYEEHETDDLTLAYACTIHKSQGSEYPAVVVVMLSSHFVMLSKGLLYTAVTRGKRLVVLVTDPNALRVSLGRDRKGDRRTALAARLMAARRS